MSIGVTLQTDDKHIPKMSVKDILANKKQIEEHKNQFVTGKKRNFRPKGNRSVTLKSKVDLRVVNKKGWLDVLQDWLGKL